VSQLPSKATEVYLDKFSIITTPEKKIAYKSDENTALDLIKRMDVICTEIVKSNDELFHSTDGKQVEYGSLGKSFLSIIKENILERIEDIFPESKFHPLIRTTMDAVKANEAGQYVRELKLYETKGKTQFIVDMLNKLVAAIRREARSDEFKARMKNHNRLTPKNRKGTFEMIDEMFRRYSKVQVVRVDLSYNKIMSRPLEMQNLSHEDVRRDFQKLLKDMRRKLFKENYITYEPLAKRQTQADLFRF